MSRRETRPLCLVLRCRGLGDILGATPLVRKALYVTGHRPMVITQRPEVFDRNPYVSAVHALNDLARRGDLRAAIEEVGQGYAIVSSFQPQKREHAACDIRQFHALELRLQLRPDEMSMDYFPDPNETLPPLPTRYVVVLPSQTWPSRSWSIANWQQLCDRLNREGVPVVSMGRVEEGTTIGRKGVAQLQLKQGVDLVNRTTLSQAWHVMDRADAIVSMDSGLLHLAGCTDSHILQLGSSIHPYFRAPYRRGRQDYRYSYLGGPCELWCASDLRYRLARKVTDITGCLEDKATFECHPNVDAVFDAVWEQLGLPSSG